MNVNEELAEVGLYAKVCGPPVNWNDLRVCVDGNECREYSEANVAEGWVRQLVLDENGRIKIHPLSGKVREETLHGKVTITERF